MLASTKFKTMDDCGCSSCRTCRCRQPKQITTHEYVTCAIIMIIALGVMYMM